MVGFVLSLMVGDFGVLGAETFEQCDGVGSAFATGLEFSMGMSLSSSDIEGFRCFAGMDGMDSNSSVGVSTSVVVSDL